jgi:YggT family protein
MPSQSFIAQWYFHVPDLVMAVLVYALAVRAILELLFAGRRDVAPLRIVRVVTRPVVSAVRRITPRILPEVLVIGFAICWLIAGRMLWFLGCVAAGMRPVIGA